MMQLHRPSALYRHGAAPRGTVADPEPTSPPKADAHPSPVADDRPEPSGDRPKSAAARIEEPAERLAMFCDRDNHVLGEIRATVAEYCADRLDSETLGDVTLVVSELVTNAFEHGVAGLVTLEVTVSGRSACVTVTSTGDSHQLAEPREWVVPSAAQITGRGLAIVHAIAESVEVHRADAGGNGRDWIAVTACIAPSQPTDA